MGRSVAPLPPPVSTKMEIVSARSKACQHFAIVGIVGMLLPQRVPDARRQLLPCALLRAPEDQVVHFLVEHEAALPRAEQVDVQDIGRVAVPLGRLRLQKLLPCGRLGQPAQRDLHVDVVEHH